MRGESLLLFVSPCIVSKRKTVFHKFDENITVEAPGTLMRQLIDACDGQHSLDEVLMLIKDEWDEQAVRELLAEMNLRGVLTDSRRLGETMWRVVENPPFFPSLVTDSEVARLVELARNRHSGGDHAYSVSQSSFTELLNRRHSVRVFSDKPVGFQALVDMSWSAYGETRIDEGESAGCRYHRTVPSAGALYPLMLHVALFRKTGDLSCGIYKATLGLPGKVGFGLVSTDTDRLARSFINPSTLDNAHGVMVISGSFDVAGEKYGNRSLLFVPLEAGHIAQNIHLSASEAGLATIEIGGFMEELLSEAASLPKGYRPLTIVVFGYEKETSYAVEPGVDVVWANPVSDSYRLPFAMALARISTDPEVSWSYGRAASPLIASTKAVSEAREWAACGCRPDSMTKACLADLGTAAIDPREIIRFHDAQYRVKGFPFAKFDPSHEYEWVRGTDELSGGNFYVLADLVYFPLRNPSEPPYAYISSSGAAANPDRQRATTTAVLELVERDAFMIAYMTRISSPTVSLDTLPREISRRVAELNRAGFDVWIKDISIDLAPAVFVFAQSRKLSYTTCAACSSFDIEHAVSHPLMEVEGAVIARLQNGGPSRLMRPREVWMPADHGLLYEQKRFFRKADFMIQGTKAVSFSEIGEGMASSWQELLDCFSERRWRLITVPLKLSSGLGGNGGLHIVRAIVPGMVPISFGYRQEPAGMDRVYAAAREFGGVRLSYANITKFPHPFS